MPVLMVGSRAARKHFPGFREPKDFDYILTWEDFQFFLGCNEGQIQSVKPTSSDNYLVKKAGNLNFEFKIAWGGENPNTNWKLLESHNFIGETFDYATPAELLLLKLSHRYRKNSPNFHKTMGDIWFFREYGVVLSEAQETLMKEREKEVLASQKAPKLNADKMNFFVDNVDYTYNHDDIHLAVAIDDKPAYTNFQKEGAEVFSSKKKFFECSERVRLNAVYEESCVLAIERAIVPYNTAPLRAFEKALQKVCTNVTSGWFREYSWENYYAVAAMYNEDFVHKFQKALSEGRISLYKGASNV